MAAEASVYEHDLKYAAGAVEAFAEFVRTHNVTSYYVNRAELELSSDGYTVGRIVYEDEQTRFVPHVDPA